MENLTLASDFAAATEADWLKLAEKALAGASFDTLRSPLYEGFKTEPLYTAGTGGVSSAPVTTLRGWGIIQPVAGAPEDAGKQIEADLAGCAASLWIDFSADGLKIDRVDQLSRLLAKSGAAGASAFYLASGASPADAALFIASFDGRSLKGCAGLDPLTKIAVTGEMPADRQAALADAVDAAHYISGRFPSFAPFLATDSAWHNAGGSIVEELSCTLATAVSYWRGMFETGADARDSASKIVFSLMASSDIFLTIAKFRAMRLLWRHAVSSLGSDEDVPAHIIAEMSPRMMTVYDAHTNLLRGTAAAFAAAIGGANAIRLHPYDALTSDASLGARHLARNTHHILSHEAYLGAVADAAHGSWYVEQMTQDLAARAWAAFQEIEMQGGMAAALARGVVQNKLRQVQDQRDANSAVRKDKITGVSVFPNLAEAHAPRHPVRMPLAEPQVAPTALPPTGHGARFSAAVEAARQGETLESIRQAYRRVHEIVTKPLLVSRSAAGFEELRLRSDAALAKLGSRPPIFLAALGSPQGFRPRALWVQGFFAAGGIDVHIPAAGFTSADEVIAAFRLSASPVACLCASNATYASLKGVTSGLKKAGASFIYLAGAATVLASLDPVDALHIDRIIYDGCDVLAILNEAHAILRVEELTAASEVEG